MLPFYAVHPAPQTLLVMQSFVLALGIIPLYKLAREIVNYRVAGLIFVLAYLLYPPLQGINWFDFHVQCFLPLFFLSTIYFFEKQNWKAYSLFIVLSLMVEEHVSMILVFIGIFGLLQHRKRILSTLKTRNFGDLLFLVPTVTIVSAVLWYFMTLWVRNAFFPINLDFLYEFNAAANWSVLGVQDPTMVPFYVFLYPARAIAALSHDFLAKISFVLILFGPLALKPFYSMKHVLPALPWFFFALFSNYQAYYGIFNQYPAYIIAFIFVAAIFVISRAKNDVIALRRGLAAVLVCSLAAFLLVSPLSPVVTIVYPEYGFKPVTPHEKYVHQVLGYVPQNASVMTQSNIFPHVSSRINAYAIPFVHPIWSGKAFEFRDFASETLENVEYILVDLKSDPAASRLVFSLMQENHEFGVYVSADSIILLKKSYNGTVKILAPYKAIYTHSNLVLYSGEVVADPDSASGTVLYFNGSYGAAPVFWYGPRDMLPPGEYNITLRLKFNLTRVVASEIFSLEICSDDGQNILNSKTFNGDFAVKDEWVNQTFSLILDKPLIDLEVRAVNVSNHVTLYLDYIEVKQVDAP